MVDPDQFPPHSFRIDLPPQVKQRPRMTRRGRVFTPAKTLNYELAAARFYDGPCFQGPVSLHATLGKQFTDVTIRPAPKPHQFLRGDLDNYVKALADSLNGVAYGDDRQIVRLYIARL